MKNLVCAPPSDTPGKVILRLWLMIRRCGSALKPAIGAEELDVQVAGDGKVEHDVDEMLVFFLGDLAERLADVLLQVGLAFRRPGRSGFGSGPPMAWVARKSFARLLDLGLQADADLGVRQLVELLLRGAGSGLIPGRLAS